MKVVDARLAPGRFAARPADRRAPASARPPLSARARTPGRARRSLRRRRKGRRSSRRSRRSAPPTPPRSSPPESAIVSRPPASNRSRAKPTRRPCCDSGPIAARNDLRPRAVARQRRVGGVAQALERLGEAQRRERRGESFAGEVEGRRRRRQDVDLRFGEIGMRADAGHRRLQPRRVVARCAPPPRRPRPGSSPPRSARGAPPARFKRLEHRPAVLAQRRRQRLEHAGAGGGIGDEAEMRFFAAG